MPLKARRQVTGGSGRLLLVGCSSTKMPDPEPLPAFERYDGPVYRTLRAFRTRGGALPEILILSAEFGLITSDKPIPDYDRRMNKATARELAQRSGDMELFKRRVSQATDVLAVAGKDYMAVYDAWSDFVFGKPSYKTAAGPIGIKLARLKKWLESQ